MQKWTRKAAAVIAVICLAFGTAGVAMHKWDEMRQEKAHEELTAQVVGMSEAGTTGETMPEKKVPEVDNEIDETNTIKETEYVSAIDFAVLDSQNPDVVAWIQIPGTQINYPVVQANNNSKYINTLFDGTSNASGAILLDCDDTAPGMVDQQTTIYGHHMNDGSMFNIISDTTDQAKFDSIEYVYYITRDGTYKLKPLVTKIVEDTYNKARTPSFDGEDGLKNYLSEMLDGASAKAYDASDRASSATKAVTLITCRSLSFSDTRAVMVLTPVEE